MHEPGEPAEPNGEERSLPSSAGREGGAATDPVTLRLGSLPELHDPILLCAFGGWNDAAQSATGALRYLIEHSGSSRFGDIDPEEFYIFTETRPTVHLIDGSQRALDWPANEFYYWRDPRLPHDLVLMLGIEPQMRWRAYSEIVLGVAHQVNARMVMMLGGLLADVAHTMPVRLTGAATHPEMLPSWGNISVRTSRYEGPTGIVGVLSDACRREQIPSATLWANVPHYINVAPNPKALAALVHRVNLLFELDLDLLELDEASERFEQQVAEAVEQNPDVRRYIRQLEEAANREEELPEPAAELPSGSAIVEELEEFLRQRHQEQEDEDEG